MTAEQEWDQFDDKLDAIDPPNAISLASWKSREAYKSALRKAIEADIEGLNREVNDKDTFTYMAAMETLKRVLKLLDTVTPE